MIPLSCVAGNAEARPDEATPDSKVIVCRSDVGQLDVMIVTDQDTSWPVIRCVGGLRSLQNDLLDAMHTFGAGLLYFDPKRDIVWVAADDAGFVGLLVSMTGNDPVTLERKRAYLAIQINADCDVELHSSRNAALNILSGTKSRCIRKR